MRLCWFSAWCWYSYIIIFRCSSLLLSFSFSLLFFICSSYHHYYHCDDSFFFTPLLFSLCCATTLLAAGSLSSSSLSSLRIMQSWKTKIWKFIMPLLYSRAFDAASAFSIPSSLEWCDNGVWWWWCCGCSIYHCVKFHIFNHVLSSYVVHKYIYISVIRSLFVLFTRSMTIFSSLLLFSIILFLLSCERSLWLLYKYIFIYVTLAMHSHKTINDNVS